jgi:structural maintenance of chromosome 1
MERFRDMEQLSGGEKTVAAVLDNVNLRKVCNYISHRSKEGMQRIVISLKAMFYENSEALVVICKDASTNSSRT